MLWSEENVELLKKLYEEGLSASLIVEQFGTKGYVLTRNSVIGKVHRLGLIPPEDKKWNRRRKPRITNDAVMIQRHVPSITKLRKYVRTVMEPIAMKEPTKKNNVLLRKINDGQCKAIIGYENGILADAVCCGENAPVLINKQGRAMASPWCDYHRDKYIKKDDHGRNR